MKRLILCTAIIGMLVRPVWSFVAMGPTWPVEQIPIVFYIQPSVSTADNEAIRDGFNIWSMVETTLFEFSYQGTQSSVLGVRDGINNNGFGTNLQFGFTLAVTQVWWDGSGAIVDVDIEFNSGSAWGVDYDLMTVAIHESGHFLGLGHETANQSIMQPIYFGTQQELLEDDINGVSSLYPGRKHFAADAVFQNAPNPFVPDTSDDYTVIGYSVKAEGLVRLELYNLAGELVKVLVDEHKPQGEYIGTRGIRWYGDNGSPGSRGRDVGSGVYIAVLKTQRNKIKTTKIMLVR